MKANAHRFERQEFQSISDLASASPAPRPRYDSNKCIPNIELTNEKNTLLAGRLTGVWMCGKDKEKFLYPIIKSYLHDEVSLIEFLYNNGWFGNTGGALNIFVLACTESLDKDVHGQPTPFLRPASYTETYASQQNNNQYLTSHEKDCDKWAHQRIALDSFFRPTKSEVQQVARDAIPLYMQSLNKSHQEQEHERERKYEAQQRYMMGTEELRQRNPLALTRRGKSSKKGGRLKIRGRSSRKKRRSTRKKNKMK